MAAKRVNVLISLKDQFSKPLGKTATETKKLEKEMQKAKNTVNGWATAANNKIKSVATTAVKKGAQIAKALGAAAFGTGTAAFGVGLAEAFDMETYKAQLETATGDTQRATELMQNAIKMANSTPFEGGELVQATALFESMGMSSEKWLKYAGDMAGATGKDILQATEAIIDANGGEWERMKEFGIKGVEDMDTLMATMDTRFAGGMEKLSKTTKGMWSTVTGISKNSLAKIVGIQDDGSVKAGSALDLIRGKIQLLADKLTQWQQDGTIDQIAEKFTTGLGSAIEFGTAALEKGAAALDWVKENANWLLPVLSGLVGAFGALQVILTVVGWWKKYQQIAQTLQVVQMGLNVAMTANPIGVLVVAIGALIAAGVALWMNWDTVKAKAVELWQKAQEVFGGIRDFVGGVFDGIKEKASGAFQFIQEKINWLQTKATELPIIGGVVQNLTGWGNAPGHALGTNYFKGGLTKINEGGRGELVQLPSGTKIFPNSETKKMGNTTNHYNIHVSVQGSNNPHETGRIIAEEIIKALPKVV